MEQPEEISPSEWDKEARLFGRLALIEHAIGALIMQAEDPTVIKTGILTQLDVMWGRRPVADLNETTAEIARGAQMTARHLLKICDFAAAEKHPRQTGGLPES